MNNWWAELYTIPLCKKLSRALLVIFFLTLILIWLLPDALGLIGWANMYVINILRKHTRKSFSANLEFHKLHVPFNELKSAYLYDLFITSGLAFFGMSFNLLLAMFYSKNLGLDSGVPAFLALNIIFCLLPYMSIGSLSASRNSYEFLSKEMNAFLFWTVSGAFYGFLCLLILLGMFFNFNPVVLFFFAMAGCFIGSTLYFLKAIFHQEMQKGSARVFLRYSFKGLFVSLAAYFVITASTRPLINLSNFNPEIRHLLFEMNGSLAPDITIDTAKDFISFNAGDRSVLRHIFAKTPGLEEVPFTEIFPKPTDGDVFNYMIVVDNPTPDNMRYLLKEIVNTQKTRQSWSLDAAAELIVQKWPKQAKFPDEYVARKESLKNQRRLPANKGN